MTLPCRRARRLLSPYLDGALRAKERRALEEHLLSCPACREELESLKRAMVALRLYGPRLDVAASEVLAQRAWERARREGAEPEVVPVHVLAKLALSGALSLFLLMVGAHLTASKAAIPTFRTAGVETMLPDEELERLRPFYGRLAMLPERRREGQPAEEREREEGASILPGDFPNRAEAGSEPAVMEVSRFPWVRDDEEGPSDEPEIG